MNLSIPLGFFIGVASIYISISAALKNVNIFFSWDGMVIVFGGTLAAALICFPFKRLLHLVMVILGSIIGSGKRRIQSTISEIIELSKLNLAGTDVTKQTATIKNPFLRECMDLWSQAILSEQDLHDVMNKRLEIQNEHYRKEGVTFKILGKFPPAYGLIGTTMGMIALLQNLGGPDAFSMIGPSMSIALTATFWGLLFSNLFLLPLGENLTFASEDDLTMRRIVIDGVMLLKEKRHPLLVEEYLMSYLSPNDRNRIKGALGNA